MGRTALKSKQHGSVVSEFLVGLKDVAVSAGTVGTRELFYLKKCEVTKYSFSLLLFDPYSVSLSY